MILSDFHTRHSGVRLRLQCHHAMNTHTETMCARVAKYVYHIYITTWVHASEARESMMLSVTRVLSCTQVLVYASA